MAVPPSTMQLCTRWSLIDIGLNLTDGMYDGKYNGKVQHKSDRESMLTRSYLSGVRGLLLTGGNLKESQSVIAMCAKYNATLGTEKGTDGQPRCRCLCTVGCHPTRADEFVKNPDAYYDALDRLITLHSVRNGSETANRCVAAVGEIGLDYDRLFFCAKETQLLYFRRQMALAEKHQLPLFLHDRNTCGEFYEVMAEHAGRFPGGVVHSFTGSAEELAQYLELGLYIGVNGCSLKTEENLDVVRKIPLDRLMIETDAPWCEVKNTHASRALLRGRAQRNGVEECESDALLSAFPVVKKEKFKEGSMVKGRCEPCQLTQVLEVVQELRREEEGARTMEELAETLARNTKQLFPF